MATHNLTARLRPDIYEAAQAAVLARRKEYPRYSLNDLLNEAVASHAQRIFVGAHSERSFRAKSAKPNKTNER